MSIDFARLEEVVLLFWDEESNYNLEITQQKIGTLFKEKILINSLDSFNIALEKYGSDQKFLTLVHLYHAKQNKGYDDFINSKILKFYPDLKFYLITSALRQLVYNDRNESLDVFTYEKFQEKVFSTFIPQTKDEIKGVKNAIQKNRMEYPQIDYAIITALYEDEFEELKKIFEFPEDLRIRTKNKIFYRGHLKSNALKKVVAAIPNATGMVDASIIATQMLEFFRPKYLLMSGVCGGAADYAFGDVIVAKQIFTFQKGKISDVQVKNNQNFLENVELFNKDGALIDHTKLFDINGDQVSINVEKFTIEHDAVINLDTAVEDNLKDKQGSICEKINKTISEQAFLNSKTIKIEIQPIACSTMVINKAGYFEDTIKAIHRKTAAVEMESYGVARACQFANDGNTIPIIFKSVMDNTVKKTDIVGDVNYKKFAAFTSAQFMKHLLEDNVI